MEVSVKKFLHTNIVPLRSKFIEFLDNKKPLLLSLYFEVFINFLLEHKLLEWRFIWKIKI